MIRAHFKLNVSHFRECIRFKFNFIPISLMDLLLLLFCSYCYCGIQLLYLAQMCARVCERSKAYEVNFRVVPLIIFKWFMAAPEMGQMDTRVIRKFKSVISLHSHTLWIFNILELNLIISQNGILIEFEFYVVGFICRLKSGVVASLNHVDLNEEKSPKLKPYPDWDVSFIKIDSKKTLSNAAGQTPLAPMPPADAAPNNATTSTTTTTTPPPPPDSVPELIDIHDFRTIVSAFQIHVDQHSRLWVLDTGSADILEDPKQIAAPAVVIIHLNSTAYNRREKIHPSVIKYDSFFTNMVRIIDIGTVHVTSPDQFLNITGGWRWEFSGRCARIHIRYGQLWPSYLFIQEAKVLARNTSIFPFRSNGRKHEYWIGKHGAELWHFWHGIGQIERT